MFIEFILDWDNFIWTRCNAMQFVRKENSSYCDFEIIRRTCLSQIDYLSHLQQCPCEQRTFSSVWACHNARMFIFQMRTDAYYEHISVTKANCVVCFFFWKIIENIQIQLNDHWSLLLFDISRSPISCPGDLHIDFTVQNVSHHSPC